MHLSPASVWGLRGWNREELSSAPLIVSSKKRQGTRHFSLTLTNRPFYIKNMKYLARNWQYSTLPSSSFQSPHHPHHRQYLHFGCHFRSMLLERFVLRCVRSRYRFQPGEPSMVLCRCQGRQSFLLMKLMDEVVMPLKKKNMLPRWWFSRNFGENFWPSPIVSENCLQKNYRKPNELKV